MFKLSPQAKWSLVLNAAPLTEYSAVLLGNVYSVSIPNKRLSTTG